MRGACAGLLLAACATRTPPHLYPDPVPPLPAPEPVVWAPAGDDCPRSEALLPGRPAPYVVDGVATCRAVVVPEARLAELLAAEAAADLWRDVAGVCRDAREADRRHAQTTHDRTWVHAVDTQQQLRAARVSGLVGVVATAGVCAVVR